VRVSTLTLAKPSGCDGGVASALSVLRCPFGCALSLRALRALFFAAARAAIWPDEGSESGSGRLGVRGKVRSTFPRLDHCWSVVGLSDFFPSLGYDCLSVDSIGNRWGGDPRSLPLQSGGLPHAGRLKG